MIPTTPQGRALLVIALVIGLMMLLLAREVIVGRNQRERNRKRAQQRLDDMREHDERRQRERDADRIRGAVRDDIDWHPLA